MQAWFASWVAEKPRKRWGSVKPNIDLGLHFASWTFAYSDVHVIPARGNTLQLDEPKKGPFLPHLGPLLCKRYRIRYFLAFLHPKPSDPLPYNFNFNVGCTKYIANSSSMSSIARLTSCSKPSRNHELLIQIALPRKGRASWY